MSFTTSEENYISTMPQKRNERGLIAAVSKIMFISCVGNRRTSHSRIWQERSNGSRQNGLRRKDERIKSSIGKVVTVLSQLVRHMLTWSRSTSQISESIIRRFRFKMSFEDSVKSMVWRSMSVTSGIESFGPPPQTAN